MALGTRRKLLRAKPILAPILCVHGMKDQFASVGQAESFMAAFKEGKDGEFAVSMEVLPSDHFFCDRQHEVAGIVFAWISGL